MQLRVLCGFWILEPPGTTTLFRTLCSGVGFSEAASTAGHASSRIPHSLRHRRRSSLARFQIHSQRARRTNSRLKILRLRHRHSRQHGHPNQPPRHGHGYRRLRTSLPPDCARHQRPLGSSAQRLRSRPAFLRLRRLVRKSSSRRRSAQARPPRQSHGAHQVMGARCRQHARQSRPLPP